ncbi:NifB/NifX family molybdenum-iron cluster-binding protein [Candidatus Xianfuyuplasma coldseepsis]|uniref:DUF134 domain-containing protein n=1 Tax=Candidatus Xianfuyuplasma coldseepsis TaxID=2782163 RepID=A0A7L7KVN4_9MOLU|nr:NifB/NifX family molybdenum-iron cluster-binding protein [Xianfuyuplasma coldseepsis]QMS85808.1 DUF134 domain-containing protein [Xianfuyuplasma coldseepsis]
MNTKRKKRYARRLDAKRYFKPSGVPRSELQTCSISLDEFEAIRLVDLEGLSQIDAASDMQVSRATIQRLLTSGRKKLVEAILDNCAFEVRNDIEHIKLKGENKMNIEAKPQKVIAFPTSDKVTIDGHFGHTKEFAIYDVLDTDINHVRYVTPPPHEPGVLPKFLHDQGIDVIITGGMGQRAVTLFNNNNIDVILGAKGRIDVNLNEYLGGFLSSQGSSCDTSHNHQHHREHHHDH